MIPGIDVLLGSIIGGGFRLGQAFLDSREKQRDRDHEFRMTDLQGQLAEKANEARMRELGIHSDMASDVQDTQMIVEAIKAQASEASASGGWVSAMSATVRPVVTYLFVAIYLSWKSAQMSAAFIESGTIAALAAAYGEADMAILASILSFWFVDRSLRRGRSPIAA